MTPDICRYATGVPLELNLTLLLSLQGHLCHCQITGHKRKEAIITLDEMCQSLPMFAFWRGPNLYTMIEPLCGPWTIVRMY